MLNRYILSIFLLLITACSKPITSSKFTQTLSLSKNYYVEQITFNNLEDEKLHFNEKEIELKLLVRLQKKDTKHQKAVKLILTLQCINNKDTQKKSSFNIHNIIAIATMLTTRVLPDTSTIDTNVVKQKLFILDVVMGEKKSKLFIEIDDYEDENELKQLFKKALYEKMEQII